MNTFNTESKKHGDSQGGPQQLEGASDQGVMDQGNDLEI